MLETICLSIQWLIFVHMAFKFLSPTFGIGTMFIWAPLGLFIEAGFLEIAGNIGEDFIGADLHSILLISVTLPLALLWIMALKQEYEREHPTEEEIARRKEMEEITEQRRASEDAYREQQRIAAKRRAIEEEERMRAEIRAQIAAETAAEQRLEHRRREHRQKSRTKRKQDG